MRSRQILIGGCVAALVASGALVLTSASQSSAAPTTVNAADYAVPGNPGSFLWTYARSPLRECGIYPAEGGRAVLCSVGFPPGTPEVSSPPFSGPPNAVKIVGGTISNTITEGGARVGRVLPPNHRIVVGDISCTALPRGGIDCSKGPRGFRYANGVLTKR